MKIKLIVSFLILLIIVMFAAYFALNPETVELNHTARNKPGGNYIELSDGVTHYRFDGPENGEVVVLVHGATIPHWGWDEQIRALSGAGYRVLSYDKYGRGYSDIPDVEYDQALYLDQLKELVDKLGLTEPFKLVGVSVGGGTIINFTAKYPDRVKKLVLISPLIRDFKVNPLFFVPVAGEFIVRVAGIRVITNRFKSQYEGHPKLDQYLKRFTEQTTRLGFQRSILSMLRNDAVADYSEAYQIVGKQDIEVLLLWGTADEEISQEMIDDILTYIPSLRFISIRDAGHGLLVQKSDRINQVILGFFKYSWRKST